jgi:WD and tetratricopeptide repeat-containing protein 1
MNLVEVLRNRELNIKVNSIKNLQANESFIERLDLQTKLTGHNGCVNCLEFSSKGNILASASDDLQVFLWDPYRNIAIKSFQTPHRGNIFSVKFLPRTNDSQVVTGAADYYMYAYDLTNPEDPIFKCRCHHSRVKRLAGTFESTHEENSNLI